MPILVGKSSDFLRMVARTKQTGFGIGQKD